MNGTGRVDECLPGLLFPLARTGGDVL